MNQTLTATAYALLTYYVEHCWTESDSTWEVALFHEPEPMSRRTGRAYLTEAEREAAQAELLEAGFIEHGQAYDYEDRHLISSPSEHIISIQAGEFYLTAAGRQHCFTHTTMPAIIQLIRDARAAQQAAAAARGHASRQFANRKQEQADAAVAAAAGQDPILTAYTQMRAVQQQLATQASPPLMQEADSLERTLDRLLERAANQAPEPQPSLF